MVPDSATDGGLGGGQLLVHRRLQRRQQLHGLHQPGRAADDRPGDAERRHHDLRFHRRGGDRRAGREGLRHGDGDGHSGGFTPTGTVTYEFFTTLTGTRPPSDADGDLERRHARPIRPRARPWRRAATRTSASTAATATTRAHRPSRAADDQPGDVERRAPRSSIPRGGRGDRRAGRDRSTTRRR